MVSPVLKNTPFVMRYEKEGRNYPEGYWIIMRDILSDNGEELVLFIGLGEQSAQSIFDRLNLFLQNWLLDSGFIKDEDSHPRPE